MEPLSDSFRPAAQACHRRFPIRCLISRQTEVGKTPNRLSFSSDLFQSHPQRTSNHVTTKKDVNDRRICRSIITTPFETTNMKRFQTRLKPFLQSGQLASSWEKICSPPGFHVNSKHVTDIDTKFGIGTLPSVNLTSTFRRMTAMYKRHYKRPLKCCIFMLMYIM